MGFLISNYSLQGLQPQSFYVSIQGNYNIQKSTGPAGSFAGLNIPNLINPYYSITFTVYYSANKEAPANTIGNTPNLPITQKQMIYNIQELPEPADVYKVIYNNIKQQLNTGGDLIFTDI